MAKTLCPVYKGKIVYPRETGKEAMCPYARHIPVSHPVPGRGERMGSIHVLVRNRAANLAIHVPSNDGKVLQSLPLSEGTHP